MGVRGQALQGALGRPETRLRPPVPVARRSTAPDGAGRLGSRHLNPDAPILTVETVFPEGL